MDINDISSYIDRLTPYLEHQRDKDALAVIGKLAALALEHPCTMGTAKEIIRELPNMQW